MIVNWIVRFKNKDFWMSLIPAAIILLQSIGSLFGYEIELTEVGERLLNVVNAMFVVLTIIGVINDPTTHGLSDSVQAMGYETPKK